MPEYAVLIVTFNGAASIVRMIDCLLAAETSNPLAILVVDNASTDNTLACIESACIENGQYQQLTVIENTQNKGLGHAFNLGVHYFHKKQFDWLLVMDQDSFVRHDFFTCYEALFNDDHCFGKEGLGNKDLGKEVTAICSNALNDHNTNIIHRPCLWDGQKFSVAPDDIEQRICDLPVVASAISSGTFYRISSVLKLGGFREDYFIDFIDHEFHLRLLSHGQKLLWNKNAVFYHNLGIKAQDDKHEAWIEHEPFRYYYMARNMAHGYYSSGGIKSLSRFIAGLPALLKEIHQNSRVPWVITMNIVMGLFHAAIGRMGKK